MDIDALITLAAAGNLPATTGYMMSLSPPAATPS